MRDRHEERLLLFQRFSPRNPLAGHMFHSLLRFIDLSSSLQDWDHREGTRSYTVARVARLQPPPNLGRFAIRPLPAIARSYTAHLLKNFLARLPPPARRLRRRQVADNVKRFQR